MSALGPESGFLAWEGGGEMGGREGGTGKKRETRKGLSIYPFINSIGEIHFAVQHPPVRVTVFCSLPMVEVGLNATRSTMFSPFEMPPWMPPLLFVRVLG